MSSCANTPLLYFPLLDFVGHFDTVQDDAKQLLERIGAWNRYGKSGWGHHKNESIFGSKSAVKHKTNARDSVRAYFVNQSALEDAIEEFYSSDYAKPMLGLSKRRLCCNHTVPSQSLAALNSRF